MNRSKHVTLFKNINLSYQISTQKKKQQQQQINNLLAEVYPDSNILQYLFFLSWTQANCLKSYIYIYIIIIVFYFIIYMNELLVISNHNKLVSELSLSWSNNFVSTIIGTQKTLKISVPNFIILHNFITLTGLL